MLRTAVQMVNEILPALTHCFFCIRCRRNIGMHQINGVNCSARHAFFAFSAFVIVLTLTTSTSVLLYQVCMPSLRIVRTRRHGVPFLYILALVLQSKLSRPRCDKQTAVSVHCAVHARIIRSACRCRLWQVVCT